MAAGSARLAVGVRVWHHHLALQVLQLLCRQHGAAVPARGPWRDYLFGEKAYVVLSLTAKALLA